MCPKRQHSVSVAENFLYHVKSFSSWAAVIRCALWDKEKSFLSRIGINRDQCRESFKRNVIHIEKSLHVATTFLMRSLSRFLFLSFSRPHLKKMQMGLFFSMAEKIVIFSTCESRFFNWRNWWRTLYIVEFVFAYRKRTSIREKTLQIKPSSTVRTCTYDPYNVFKLHKTALVRKRHLWFNTV